MFLSKRGSIWYIWYKDEATGKKRKISTGCFRKSDALKYLQTHSLSIQPQVQPPSPPPVPVRTPVQYPPQRRDASPTHYISEFKSEFASTNALSYSPGTLQIYERAFRSLIDVIGDVPLASVTTRDTDIYKAKRLETISPPTVNMELRTLKAAFNTALRWQYIEMNPFTRVRMVPVPEQSPSYFTKEHFEKFIARLEEEWFKEIVVFAVLTGLRRSEIVNLKWSKVDLQRGILMVESEGNFKTKQGRRRVVPLNQSAKDLLNAMHERNAEGYVFRFEGAKIEPGLLSHKFKDCLRRTNLDKKELHFHSLRHTFASWLVQNSVSIYAVKELLGHTDVKTTQIYSHLSGSSLQNEVNLINISAKA